MFGFFKSNTVQVNAIFVALWTALSQSEWIQSNPEYAAILGGVQALLGILLRTKTKVPLSER